MMRQLFSQRLFYLFFMHSAVWAGSGSLFNVTTTGATLAQTVNYTLCLTINGRKPLSCQNYSTQRTTLTIRTAAPHHTYHYAGIKINTAGYTYIAQGLRASASTQLTRETAAEGYTFIGTVSDTHPATGTVSGTAALSISITDLALSISGLTLNGQASGQPRAITISNTGDATATGLAITYPAWPAGTTATSDCGSTLAAGSQCTITVRPSTTPTSNCSTGIAPTPGIITVGAAGIAPVTSQVVVLSYGCIYQGGYVFSMTETADTAASIGGTVVTQTDLAARFPNGVVWSSNSTNTGAVFDSIYGIDESSTTSTPSPANNPALTACDGATNGSCNSNNIIAYYSPPITSPAITPSYYAAGRCKATISGYSDWYLPAICEMGPASGGSGCVAGTQNIVTQLPDLVGDPNAGNPDTSCNYGANCLAGIYWSSTEDSSDAEQLAWQQYFDSVGGSLQDGNNKNVEGGVRCTRILTR